MKKIFLLSALFFASPAFATTNITKAQITAQQGAVATAKVAVVQQKATNDAAMAPVTASLQSAQDALQVMQAQYAQQNPTATSSTTPVTGR